MANANPVHCAALYPLSNADGGIFVASAFGTIPRRDVSFVVIALLTIVVMASPNDVPSWLSRSANPHTQGENEETSKHLCERLEDATGYALFMRESDT